MSGPAEVVTCHSWVKKKRDIPVLTVISSSLKDSNAFLHSSTSESLIVWRIDSGKQSKVDTKRFACHFASFSDSGAKGFRRRLSESGQNSKTACIADGCDKFWKPNLDKIGSEMMHS